MTSNAFPHALPFAHVIKGIAGKDLYTTDLGGMTLGLFDSTTWKSLSSGANSDSVFVAVGSPNIGSKASNPTLGFDDKNSHKESFKSFQFGPVYNFFTVGPRDEKPFIGYYGYNGVNDCESIKMECGETVKFEVRVQGKSVENVFRVSELFETFYASTECCDACDDSCDSTVDCKATIDKIVSQMNNPRSKVSKFGTFYTVSSCDTDPVIPTFPATKWCLEICDSGDAEALSSVRSQYPTLDIVRIDRVGTISKYSVCIDGTTAPAPFSTAGIPVIANCETCPAGYTLVPGGKIYTVVIDNDNSDLTEAAWLAEVQAKFPDAISATKLGFALGVSTYSVVLPAKFVIPDPLPTETTISGPFGEKGSICTITAITTIDWTNCGSFYKTKRKMCLTLKNEDCAADNSNLLNEIISTYSDGKKNWYYGIVPDSITEEVHGDCNSVFTIEQYSNNCMEDGCDTKGTASYDNIPGFKGYLWGECPCAKPAEASTGCKCGIKVVGKTDNCIADSCTYDVTDYLEFDMPTFEIYRLDDPSSCGTKDPSWFIAQMPVETTMTGHQVMQDILTYRTYRGEIRFSPNQEMGTQFNKAEGLVYGIEPCKKYWKIDLLVGENLATSMSTSFGDRLQSIRLYVDNVSLRDDIINLLSTYTTKFNIGKNIQYI